ncbi:MAG: ATP-grasp fold amidoligase family protein [bacterium]|nr:ATP-grasp fold amidoligase family protein [bacterium]
MKVFLATKDKLKDTRCADLYRILRGRIQQIYYRTLSDEKYLNFRFKKIFGKEISKDNPQSFNEKLQWLKLYWYAPDAEICSDKYAVRGYLEEIGLGHLLNDLIAVYDSVNEIDINRLPEKFVLKCTHGSGYNIICENKYRLNWIVAKAKLQQWIRMNYYWSCREWVYRNIKPRIVCERFLKDDATGELYDYRFFCFDGEPELVYFSSERPDRAISDFYDLNWSPLSIGWGYEPSGKVFPKPIAFEKMIGYARKLSSGFPHVRVDFYEVNGKVYFGELTFFHGGGFGRFFPDEIDVELGNRITLPVRNK